MILMHGANSIKRGGGNTERIGDKDYRVAIMPDGNVWMCENLDYAYEGLPIGSSTSSGKRATYIDNDPNVYGWNGRKCGLLYNFDAVSYLEANKSTLIPGWHVPTASEWNSLITAVSENPGTKLKALDNSIVVGFPSNWNGLDSFGFGVVPCGYAIQNDFYCSDDEAWYITIPAASPSHTYFMRFTTGSAINQIYDAQYHFAAVRLVKDAT